MRHYTKHDQTGAQLPPTNLHVNWASFRTLLDRVSVIALGARPIVTVKNAACGSRSQQEQDTDELIQTSSRRNG